VSAWPESTTVSPGPVIDPQVLIWAGLLTFVVVMAVWDILSRRRQRRHRQTGLDGLRPTEDRDEMPGEVTAGKGSSYA